MKRIGYLTVLIFLALSLLGTSVQGADFGPIFPKQVGKMVTSPNFTWAAGDYDCFVLMVFAPIPGYWYQPIRIPSVNPYFLMPQSWWDAMVTDGWGLWLVFGINTTTWDYEVTPLRFFQKVTDCVVNFPDANLQSVIRAAISKPTGAIMASDLTNLTVLDADHGYISDLRGVEYCVNVTELDLRLNQISGINCLAGLTKLTSLSLPSNEIMDISSLAGLTRLEFLVLSDNEISDISPLAGLTRLEFLVLSDNEISDISPLENLTQLWTLDLQVNYLSDVSPLAELTDLEGLLLYRNDISDVSPLAGLTNLRGLGLGHNQVSNISPLAGLSNLELLFLYDNQISDLTPLGTAQMNHLMQLDLDGNQIFDIYPLVQNTDWDFLQELHLERNDLSWTSCTVYIPELQARGIFVIYDCLGP